MTKAELVQFIAETADLTKADATRALDAMVEGVTKGLKEEGKVTLVGKQWENWTANQHIIRVVPANNDVAGYISTFLSSDYGYELIKRFTYGSVVDEIDDNHVRQIQIPILKNQDIQKQINDLALQANEKRYQAYLLEQEALKVLDEEVIYAE